MTMFSALRIGLKQTNQTKWMIFFAWLANVTLSLVVAVPLLIQLNDSIKNTVNEEQLLQRIDENWFQTFRMNHESSEVAQSMNYSIFGYAPFLTHYEGYLSGTIVKNIGNFFFDLFFKWRFGLEYLSILTVLAFIYVLVSTFFAGGFIGTYAKPYRLSFNEFLMEGANYFGKFFRLSLLSLIVYLVFFEVIVDWWSHSIPLWTANDPSEMTPFIHYMIRDIVVIIVLGLITLCFDYAKIRMVVEGRMSALFAFWAGIKFAVRHGASTVGLYVLLSLAGIGLIALYALIEGSIPQRGYWTIFVVFVLQQLYMFARLWLKALFFSSQTQLYTGLAEADHRAMVETAQTAR